MDLNTRLDSVADDLMREYQYLLSSFVALFARALDLPNPTSPLARHDLENKLQQASISFYGVFHERLREAVTALVTEALDAANAHLSSDKRVLLDTLVSGDIDGVTTRLIGIEMNDEAKVRKVLRDIALQVYLRSARGRVSQMTALIGARRGKVADLKFVQTDRAGRNWNSAILVRTMVRQVLLHIYVESFLYGRVSVGADLAKVVYPNPDHADNGLVFSISGATEGYPTYDEIKDRIFHPNSTASVEAK